jgi:membrane protease subunit HflK
VLRFGELRAQQAEPGLLVHAPFPIDRVETVRTDEVRSAKFGFDEDRARTAGDRTAESEVVAGDETILRITYVVHYRVSDAREFKFGVADPEKAVRSATESAARRMVARRSSEEVLVGSREEMQLEMLAIVREELGALHVGIEPVSVHLVYVHVPQRVHEAYLDVTSALDDKEASTRDAEKYRAERQAQARARARATEETALANQSEILEKARGEAAAFDAVRVAHEVQPEIDNQRRVRAAIVRALERSALVLLFANDVDVRLFDTAPSTKDAEGARPEKLPEPMDDR